VIVTLLPSATEIVCALGQEARLVGRSHECDFPSSVQALPALTAPAFEPGGSSAEIDRDVKSLLSRALSVYRVDAEKLAALRPSLIVTQTQCDVCAVSEDEVRAALASVTGVQPRIVSLAPKRLADVWRDIWRVADALDVPSHGAALVARLEQRVVEVSESARAHAERPTVATIEWLEPLMAAGNWVPELIELAGGHNLFGAAGQHSPWLKWDALVAADPDVIVVMPCGFDLARTRAELSLLTARPGWHELRAVRQGRVAIVDGNQYFNRPGPRLVDSLEILVEILHGGEPGDGWERA
jgi:iron complex transport system substrate-binding protein